MEKGRDTTRGDEIRRKRDRIKKRKMEKARARHTWSAIMVPMMQLSHLRCTYFKGEREMRREEIANISGGSTAPFMHCIYTFAC
jgi:hypothetical protein